MYLQVMKFREENQFLDTIYYCQTHYSCS